MQRHTVSDIYTTDHNRLPSVDCDAFGFTANVSGIKVWVIPLQYRPYRHCLEIPPRPECDNARQNCRVRDRQTMTTKAGTRPLIDLTSIDWLTRHSATPPDTLHVTTRLVVIIYVNESSGIDRENT
jgi:hypothetical protein